MRPMTQNRSRGMTLIELIVAMLVLAILMSIGIPSFREFAGNSRSGAAASSLISSLNLARSEALKRSSLVSVCPSVNQADCVDALDWSTGWLVFADPNGNGEVDANELLQISSPLQGGTQAMSTAERATYNTMGMAQIAGAGSVTFTVYQPGCAGPQGRQMVLTLTGALQTTKIACPP
jgi:type IV fimbrial biogenesis protein FimT